MKNWEDDDDDEYCSTRQDLIDAAAAADVVGIELEAVNFATEYKDRVFAEFLREYSAGRTPNPMFSAMPRSSSRPFLTTRSSSVPTTSPPDTTLGSVSAKASSSCCAQPIRTRTRAIFCTG